VRRRAARPRLRADGIGFAARLRGTWLARPFRMTARSAPLDPATLCARTAAGDAELAAPRHGLAIAQRRLLSFLDHPMGVDELAKRPGVLPERLGRDLARLVESALVELHVPPQGAGPDGRAPRIRPGAGMARASPAGPGSPSAGTGEPVVIGRKIRRGRALLVGLLALVAVVGAAWWFATPQAPAPPPRKAEPARRDAPGAAVVASVEPAMPRSAPPSSVSNAPETVPPAGTAAPRIAAARDDARPAAAPASSTPVPAGRPEFALAGRAPPAPAAPPAVVATPSSPPAPPPASAPPPPPVATATVQAPSPPPAAAPGTTPAAATAPATAPPAVSPPTQLAAAAPATIETRPPSRPLAPVTRESPEFPREALQAGVEKGLVRARLAIDASGRVTGVEILDSQPRRVFDRAVTRTLARWTYEPGAAGRTAVVEIAFDRD